MIEVFRAITGPGRYDPQKGLTYTGVSEQLLHTLGITCTNRSAPQSGSPLVVRVSSPDFTVVPGLPVFLNESEAEAWLRRRNVTTAESGREGTLGLAVLGSVAIDDSLLADGTLQICKNAPYIDDRRLSLAELRQHQAGLAPISGECYMPDFPLHGEVGQRLREATTLRVPRAHELDGTIDFDCAPLPADPGVIDLGMKPFIDITGLVDLRLYGDERP
jgi:hypothetical protein